MPPTAPTLGVPCPHHESDAFLKEYALSQLNTYERSAGWVFWNFKTESAPYWSYFHAVEKGWIPADASTIPSAIARTCPNSFPV